MSETSNWFHGILSRSQAEKVLHENGFDEGLFLVRNSSSAIGDFVLSVVHKEEVIFEDHLFYISCKLIILSL